MSNNNQVSVVQTFQTSLAKEQKKIESLLPNHISIKKFMRTIMTAIQSNPKLLNYDHKSIIDSAMNCATDGLLPDGREAAFVPFKGKVQYIPMYFGLLKRIRNSGLICSIEANVIYKNDYFKWSQGSDPKLEHIPLFPGDRGEMIGVYAIAFYKGNNEKQFAVFDKNYIDKVMESKKNSKGEIPEVWISHYDAMAQKTALRRLSKFLPMDAKINDLFDRGEYEIFAQPTIEQDHIVEDIRPQTKLDILIDRTKTEGQENVQS